MSDRMTRDGLIAKALDLLGLGVEATMEPQQASVNGNVFTPCDEENGGACRDAFAAGRNVRVYILRIDSFRNLKGSRNVAARAVEN